MAINAISTRREFVFIGHSFFELLSSVGLWARLYWSKLITVGHLQGLTSWSAIGDHEERWGRGTHVQGKQERCQANRSMHARFTTCVGIIRAPNPGRAVLVVGRSAAAACSPAGDVAHAHVPTGRGSQRNVWWQSRPPQRR